MTPMSFPELRNVSKSYGEGLGLRWRRRLRRSAAMAGGVLAVAQALPPPEHHFSR
jgi:hypothetical protein